MSRMSREEKKNQPLKLVRQPSILRDILFTIGQVIFLVAFVIFFLSCVGQRVEVEGSSMKSTLLNKDQLIVDCFSYRFLQDPKREDIVVFRLKSDPGTYYVKRIIGLPGETIQIQNSVIYINGEAIEDPYPDARNKTFSAGSAQEPILLKSDEYFVLGDNRNDSRDSRDPFVGVVKRSQLIGRAWLRIWPFEKRANLVPEGN